MEMGMSCEGEPWAMDMFWCKNVVQHNKLFFFTLLWEIFVWPRVATLSQDRKKFPENSYRYSKS